MNKLLGILGLGFIGLAFYLAPSATPVADSEPQDSEVLSPAAERAELAALPKKAETVAASPAEETKETKAEAVSGQVNLDLFTEIFSKFKASEEEVEERNVQFETQEFKLSKEETDERLLFCFNSEETPNLKRGCSVFPSVDCRITVVVEALPCVIIFRGDTFYGSSEDFELAFRTYFDALGSQQPTEGE